ncbi:hypothetical protein FOL47_009195 [Perkinsus chesapeaki]|uniref:Protein kinase domain-containing protein n=1 Tax=Perkinsus chesapeaki TaxID=330153 RepID=A0A7J6L9X9_PERCH|nr:hypothetical protein FOL47_009195 [Perkinsus chesapeaki]
MARVAVGPYVKGSKGEVYELIEQLQSALFGGVYRARGLTTGRDYAVKVLHKQELARIEREATKTHRGIEFCERPLSEVMFASKMKENQYVLELLDHTEDDHCHYLASPLARGGDLLEALKEISTATDGGFQERVVKSVVAEAAEGIAYLHRHCLALQDVSLENMLLFVDPETGSYTIKICDPGQATEFMRDTSGREQPIPFKGLVGKSFRPPELYAHKRYIATAVDSWCLGWSIFYLLTARSLFQSADPRSGDKDWAMFAAGNIDALFRRKAARHMSSEAKDLILRLMELNPVKRLSVEDALKHPWFTDCPKPSLWPAPSHLVIEEKEMVDRIKSRREVDAIDDAASQRRPELASAVDTVRERTGSTTSSLASQRIPIRGVQPTTGRHSERSTASRPSITKPSRPSVDSRPSHRLSVCSSSDGKSLLGRSSLTASSATRLQDNGSAKKKPEASSTARIVGFRNAAGSPLYGSAPCYTSPRSPRVANAIALNAYHTRLCRSPSPPPQRVPHSAVPKWDAVVENINARARSPSPMRPPQRGQYHYHSPAVADSSGRSQLLGSDGRTTLFVSASNAPAALRSRSPSFVSFQGSSPHPTLVGTPGWLSPSLPPRRSALSPNIMPRELRLIYVKGTMASYDWSMISSQILVAANCRRTKHLHFTLTKRWDKSDIYATLHGRVRMGITLTDKYTRDSASESCIVTVAPFTAFGYEMAGASFSPNELQNMMQLFEICEASEKEAKGSVGPSNAPPNQKVTIKSATQMRREQEAKAAEAKAKQDSIWHGEDFKKHSGVAIPEGKTGAGADQDPRKKPEYKATVLEVSANDMFLNLQDTDPSSDRCTEITVKIHLPNTQLKDISLDVLRERVMLQAPKYRLSLPLPYAVDEERGNAKWDKLRGCLTLTLPMIRDVKYVTDPRAVAPP